MEPVFRGFGVLFLILGIIVLYVVLEGVMTGSLYVLSQYGTLFQMYYDVDPLGFCGYAVSELVVGCAFTYAGVKLFRTGSNQP